MENYKDLTYEMLPASWLFCFLDSCPQAGQCLRHISSELIPDNRNFGKAIYPTVLKQYSCEFFKSARKIKGAYGFNTLFKEVKSKDEKILRDCLKDYLGSHTGYYRYHHGAKVLSPEQQDWIISLFKHYGYTDNLNFDHYCYVYNWQ